MTETCDQCHNNKKKDRKNKMVTYRSGDFNESVSIDLTEWFDKKEGKKKITCHMIDQFSRLSAVTFISDETPNSVMKSVTEQWLSNYGTCQKLLHDLGGEFNGKELRDLLGTMGITVSTTAAYSPFSNGIVERHNAIIKTMMDKLREDEELNGLDSKTILKQACFAKNCLMNRHGFSPFQLVFGKTQNPLNVDYNDQTCGKNNSRNKFENLQVKARKEFIKAENKIRIEAALRHDQSVN